MSESMLTARFLRNLLKMAVMTMTMVITLMKMMLLVMMRNLLRMVGDEEVGRSREQGVDLRKRKFLLD